MWMPGELHGQDVNSRKRRETTSDVNRVTLSIELPLWELGNDGDG